MLFYLGKLGEREGRGRRRGRRRTRGGKRDEGLGKCPGNSLMIMGPEDILKAVMSNVCCEIVLHRRSIPSLNP